MHRIARAASLGLALAITGCVGSLYAVWSGPDMMMDRRLIGTWKDSTGNDWYEVSASGPFTYRIVMHDDSGRIGRFQGQLGRIGDRLVLDVQPDVTVLNTPDMYTGLLQPLHGFITIDNLDTRPRLAVLNPDSLKQYMVAHPGAIRGDTLTAGVVLSAAPAPLKTFLAAYLRRPGVLGDPATFVRRGP